MNSSFNSVIIVAAGAGKRMNSSVAKQFIEINEKTILAYTIEKFENCSEIHEIIIVVNKDSVEFCRNNIVNKYNFEKVKHIVEGGKERQDSVYNGLLKANKKTDIVLIHDGVRPFIESENIKEVIEQTKKYDCCVLGVKVKDTIKVCDENGFILQTPDRSFLWAAQTPQAFKYNLILEAYEKALSKDCSATDDSVIAEMAGHKVKLVEGSYENIKITTKEDLAMWNFIKQ